MDRSLYCDVKHGWLEIKVSQKISQNDDLIVDLQYIVELCELGKVVTNNPWKFISLVFETLELELEEHIKERYGK